MKSEAVRSTLRVTKALADLQRVRILMMLQPGELCVCQIVEVLGLAPSTVSKHLAVLDGAGLIESRKEGRWMHYRLPNTKAKDGVAPVLRWLADTLAQDKIIRQDKKRLSGVIRTTPEALCLRQRKRSI